MCKKRVCSELQVRAKTQNCKCNDAVKNKPPTHFFPNPESPFWRMKRFCCMHNTHVGTYKKNRKINWETNQYIFSFSGNSLSQNGTSCCRSRFGGKLLSKCSFPSRFRGEVSSCLGPTTSSGPRCTFTQLSSAHSILLRGKRYFFYIFYFQRSN